MKHVFKITKNIPIKETYSDQDNWLIENEINKDIKELDQNHGGSELFKLFLNKMNNFKNIPNITARDTINLINYIATSWMTDPARTRDINYCAPTFRNKQAEYKNFYINPTLYARPLSEVKKTVKAFEILILSFLSVYNCNNFNWLANFIDSVDGVYDSDKYPGWYQEPPDAKTPSFKVIADYLKSKELGADQLRNLAFTSENVNKVKQALVDFMYDGEKIKPVSEFIELFKALDFAYVPERNKEAQEGDARLNTSSYKDLNYAPTPNSIFRWMCDHDHNHEEGIGITSLFVRNCKYVFSKAAARETQDTLLDSYKNLVKEYNNACIIWFGSKDNSIRAIAERRNRNKQGSDELYTRVHKLLNLKLSDTTFESGEVGSSFMQDWRNEYLREDLAKTSLKNVYETEIRKLTATPDSPIETVSYADYNKIDETTNAIISNLYATDTQEEEEVDKEEPVAKTQAADDVGNKVSTTPELAPVAKTEEGPESKKTTTPKNSQKSVAKPKDNLKPEAELSKTNVDKSLTEDSSEDLNLPAEINAPSTTPHKPDYTGYSIKF